MMKFCWVRQPSAAVYRAQGGDWPSVRSVRAVSQGAGIGRGKCRFRCRSTPSRTDEIEVHSPRLGTVRRITPRRSCKGLKIWRRSAIRYCQCHCSERRGLLTGSCGGFQPTEGALARAQTAASNSQLIITVAGVHPKTRLLVAICATCPPQKRARGRSTSKPNDTPARRPRLICAPGTDAESTMTISPFER